MDVPYDQAWIITNFVETDCEVVWVCRGEGYDVASTRISRRQRDGSTVVRMLG